MMKREEVVEDYLAAGRMLIRVEEGGKAPVDVDWGNLKIGAKALRKWKGNLGMALKYKEITLDCDPRNGGLESLARLEQDIGMTIPPHVTTWRNDGGFHCNMRVPEGDERAFNKKLRVYPGIDLLGEGAQVLVPSSTIEDGEYVWADDEDGLGCFEEIEAPAALLDLFAKTNGVSAEGHSPFAEGHSARDGDAGDLDDLEDLGDFAGIIGGPGSAQWSEEKVREIVSVLDPGMGNDEWVRVGMALKVWHPVEGLEIWETWSIGGGNYVEGETAKRWRSFDTRAGDGGVSMGTIVHMARAAGWRGSIDAGLGGSGGGGEDREGVAERVDGWMLDIDLAGSIGEIELDICREIRGGGWIGDGSREKLARGIQSRMAELIGDGVRVPIAGCRKMITVGGGADGEVNGDGDAPDWCNRWVYVNSHRGYIDFKTLSLFKTEAFNLINSHRTFAGGMTASAYASATAHVQVVHSMEYLPMYSGKRIVNIDGRRIVNTFNARSVPDMAAAYSSEGKAAISRIKRHLLFICGEDEEKRDWFIQWLAHQVQYPGELVLYAPVFCGIEGVGKTALDELLRAVLGHENVGKVGPAQAASRFNSWAMGVCVNILEELKITGHNRYETMNALKTVITDPVILIEQKGVDPMMVRNVTNYIVFTNFLDALALLITDRRYWMNQVLITDLSQLKDHVGEEATVYFPALFEAIRGHGLELRRWLMRVKITDEFRGTKQAPMTDFKAMAVATEEAGVVGMGEVKALLAEGDDLFNEEVICAGAMWEALFELHNVTLVIDQDKARLLKRLRFQRLPKPIKIKGKTRDVWVKVPMTNSQVRKKLKQGN